MCSIFESLSLVDISISLHYFPQILLICDFYSFLSLTRLCAVQTSSRINNMLKVSNYGENRAKIWMNGTTFPTITETQLMWDRFYDDRDISGGVFDQKNSAACGHWLADLSSFHTHHEVRESLSCASCSHLDYWWPAPTKFMCISGH